MNEERITRLPPFMFFVYWGFSIFNFWIHYNNYYKGGLSDTDDYILYAIEIAICIAVIIVTGKYSCFSGIPIIMKAMIFVDWLQVLISITVTDLNFWFKAGSWYNLITLAAVLYVFTVAAKLLLDCFLYKELMYDKTQYTIWFISNAVILIFAVIMIFRYWFKYLIFAAMFFRYFYALLRILGSYYEKYINWEESFFRRLSYKKISNKVRLAALAFCFFASMLFLWLCFDKTEGKYVLTSNDGQYSVKSMYDSFISSEDRNYVEDENVVEYCVSNRMPEWTGFQRKWYGLFDVNNGVITDTVYKGWLNFDASGIAWDYNGHFIDIEGNELITVPSVILKRRSARTGFYNDVLDFYGGHPRTRRFVTINGEFIDIYGIAQGDDNYYRDTTWHGEVVQDGNIAKNVSEDYFSNHLAIFYSEVDGAYGVINDQGEVTVEPIITKYSLYNELIYVYIGRQRNIVGTGGKLVLTDDEAKCHLDIDFDNKIISINYYGYSKDFEGNVIED